MVDYCKELVSALNSILETHYEMALTKHTQLPCISWQERNNYVQVNGDTLEYSKVSFTVKVWANNIADIMKYSCKVDEVLRPLGFKRTSSNELYDMNSTTIQKIMVYEATFLEDFE